MKKGGEIAAVAKVPRSDEEEDGELQDGIEGGDAQENLDNGTVNDDKVE